MSDYKLSDYKEAGIHQFVRDLSSPMQDEYDKNAQKENVAYFTPVQYLQPPLICPFPFNDKLTGENLDFPSKEEWLECPNHKKTALYHRAIDDFESYRADYNNRVDEYFKEKKIDKDIVAQEESGIWKYEKGLSHFAFMTINHRFHFNQVSNNSANKWHTDLGLHWRKVDNELVYNAIVDIPDKVAIPMINKTVYDYIRTVTGGRDLQEGDLYYFSMRELLRWTEAESIDFNAVPNVLEAEKARTELPAKAIKVKGLREISGAKHPTKPKQWTVVHHMDKHSLEFKFNFDDSLNSGIRKYSEFEFHYHKAKKIPRRVQLLENYAVWEEMRKKAPKGLSLSWEDCIIIKNRHYTMKIQRELEAHLKVLLKIEDDMFAKQEENIGGRKFTYYEPLFYIETAHSPKESFKRYTKESQKKSRSGIDDWVRAQQTGEAGIESGVFHGALDDSDLIDQ